MAINTSDLDKAVSFINAYGSLLKDEDNVKFFASLPESIAAAKKAMADNEEKYAIMLDCVTRWANQLAFALFRDGTITDQIEDDFYALLPVAETTARAKAFADARKERIDDINLKHDEIIKEQKGLGIFQAILSGMSEEQAKEKQAEYDNQVAQASRMK